MSSRRAKRVTAVVLAVVVIGAVLVVVLWPAPVDRPYYGAVVRWLRSLRRDGGPAWLSYGLLEQAGNVLLFVPFGLVMAVVWRRRWWAALLVCIVTSTAIETAQFMFLPARQGTVLDVVLNSAGAAMGVGLVVLVRRLHRRGVARLQSRKWIRRD